MPECGWGGRGVVHTTRKNNHKKSLILMVFSSKNKTTLFFQNHMYRVPRSFNFTRGDRPCDTIIGSPFVNFWRSLHPAPHLPPQLMCSEYFTCFFLSAWLTACLRDCLYISRPPCPSHTCTPCHRARYRLVPFTACERGVRSAFTQVVVVVVRSSTLVVVVRSSSSSSSSSSSKYRWFLIFQSSRGFLFGLGECNNTVRKSPLRQLDHLRYSYVLFCYLENGA